MKKLYATLFLGFCFITYSQTDYTQIYDGDAYLNEGIRLYDEGNYTEAIKEFERIVKNDPLYYTAQYEKAIALAATENDDTTQAFYEEAYSKGYMEMSPDFYMAYGNFLSDHEDYEKAEEMFNKAEKVYPEHSVLLYNMALLYIRKDERQKSVYLLQKAITTNPNHAGSHYLLGLLALEDGRAVEGTMALLAYLTLVPESTVNESIILKLNSKFSENYLEEKKLNFSKTGGDNFDKIDVILRNSLPLKNVYKVKSTIDDVIIRQVQAIVEYAAEHKCENGFFETTYIPWLADIHNKNYFEGFSYHILLGMKDKLGKKLTSQNKKINDYKDNYYNESFWEVFAKRNVDLFGKQEEVVVYLKNYKPYYLGKVVNGKSEGKYKVLNTNGNITAELNFADNELDGHQKYFNDKGLLTEEKNFKNGTITGERILYYTNGNLNLVENYNEGELHGISTSYYINGGKKCEGNFVNGEREGLFTCYYENGSVKSKTDFANGEIHGNHIEFDEVGNISREGNFTNGKGDGRDIEYYDGKVIKTEIGLTDGVISSPYKSYFANGTLKEHTNYTPDGIRSNSTFYFANGKKYYEVVYDKEGNVATYSYYDSNENKFFEENYKGKDIKPGMQFEQGVAKPTVVPINNKDYYTIKDFEGKILLKGKYIKGKKTGEWNYYYPSGSLKTKESFTEGKLSGKKFHYNEDARLRYVTNHVNDTIHGVYEEYDKGRLSETYYYKNGDLNGPARSFYPDGTVASERFFISDKLYSKKFTYWQNSRIRTITHYEEDVDVKFESFNPEGIKENEIEYSNNSGKLVTSFNNGCKVHVYTLKNGVLDGKYTIKDKRGKTLLDCDYVAGRRNGKYLSYSTAGKTMTEFNYYAGLLNGAVKYYDLAGNLRLSDNYIFGYNTGTMERYYNNKQKFSKSEMFEGEKDGEVTYYNLQGDAVLILGFSLDELKYYITYGNDGKLTNKVPVERQTAKITSVYTNGNKAMELNFVKGKLDGKFLIYSPEGKVAFDANYDMGLLSGTRTEYYTNGKVYKKEYFENSIYEGVQEYFKEDGTQWITAEYKNDEMHGLFKIYTNNEISQIDRYDSNEIVEVLK